MGTVVRETVVVMVGLAGPVLNVATWTFSGTAEALPLAIVTQMGVWLVPLQPL